MTVWGQRVTRSRTSAAVQPWYKDLWLVYLRFRFQNVIALASRPSWRAICAEVRQGIRTGSSRRAFAHAGPNPTDRIWLMAEHLAAVRRRQAFIPRVHFLERWLEQARPFGARPCPSSTAWAVPAAAHVVLMGTAEHAAGGTRTSASPRTYARGGVDGGVRQRSDPSDL